MRDYAFGDNLHWFGWADFPNGGCMGANESDSIVGDLNMRIELTRMIDRTLAMQNGALAAILKVAIGTLDQHIVSPRNRAVPDKAPSPDRKMICRNVRIGGRRTSLKLEVEYWEAIEAMAIEGGGIGLGTVCEFARRDYPDRSLASAVRVYVLAVRSKAAGRASPEIEGPPAH